MKSNCIESVELPMRGIDFDVVSVELTQTCTNGADDSNVSEAGDICSDGAEDILLTVNRCRQ